MNKIFEFGNNFIEAAGNKINNLKISENVGSVIGNITGGKSIGSVYEINGRRYTSIRLIAEGGFGFVYQVRDDYNNLYALKRMILQDKERLGAIKNEIDVMQRLRNNSNIVKLEGFKMNENYERRETEVLMLIELCQGGSVLDIMNERMNRKLDEREILAIFSDVCLGVLEMHSQQPPIAHRDLKIENILYSDSSNRYKICDFGSATTRTFNTKQDSERRRAEDDINLFTTLFYRSPEMADLYRGDIINEKVDIWALGCLLFKMAFYADPFDGGALQIINNKYTIPENSRYSDKLHNLIRAILVTSPVDRPSIYDVLNMLQDFKGSNSRKQQFTPPNHSRPSSNTNSSTSTPSTNSPILGSSNGGNHFFDQSSLNRSSSSSSLTSNRNSSGNINNSPQPARNLFDLLDGKPPSNRSSPVPSRHHNTNNDLNNSGNNYFNGNNNSNSGNSIPLSKSNNFGDGFEDIDAWGPNFQPSGSLNNSNNSINGNNSINNSNSSINSNKKKTIDDDFGDLFSSSNMNNSNNSVKSNNSNSNSGNISFNQNSFTPSKVPSTPQSNSSFDFQWSNSTLTPTPVSQQYKPTVPQNNQKPQFDFGDFESFSSPTNNNNNSNINNSNINNSNNNIQKNSFGFTTTPTSNLSTPINYSNNNFPNLNGSVLSPMTNNNGFNNSPSTSSPNQQRTNTTNFSQNLNYKPNYNVDLNSYTNNSPLPQNNISPQYQQQQQQQKVLNFDIFK